jgi:hypothetical protein
MGKEIEMDKDQRHVHVTLETREAEAKFFRGKIFPCPICGLPLQVRVARTAKPYCHCDPCGIQLFFRGREGVERLREILKSEMLISGKGSSAAVLLYNRVQQLKAEKRELEKKQGILIRNTDLENTIAAVQTEIEGVQSELEELSGRNRRRNKK